MHALSTAAAVLSGLALVSAHGHVSSVQIDGTNYRGADPSFQYNSPYPTDVVGWRAQNLDNGFVEPNNFGTADVNCHKSSQNAPAFATARAGSRVTFTWNTWPVSHVGPVIDYISPHSTTATGLRWTKIAQKGHVSGSNPGKWATDDLIAAGNKWTITLPNLAPGDYVLRHEIIALHAGGNPNGAQSYPQCINIRVTGSGGSRPSGGVAGTSLYRANDAGIQFNPFRQFTSYPIPGPALSTVRKLARFNAEDNKVRAEEA